MNNNRTFLIVLGDTENHHFHDMYYNILEIGNVKKILDNVYVLSIERDENYEEIRNKVSGATMGYCIVISLDNLKAAWHLQPKDSEYLKSFFKDEQQ